MTISIRDIQHEEVVDAIKPLGKPKPTKAGREKKKRHVWGICIQCGTTWKDEVRHSDECPQELPVKKWHKYHSESWMLEEALDDICRLITEWRDGVTCVINTSECGGVSQWGHVIPQGSNSWLKHNLSNSFRQCANHNGLHQRVQAPYYLWYSSTFGKKSFQALDDERKAVSRYSWTPAEMRERLIEYNYLYGTRFMHAGDSLGELIDAGYYGDIIRKVWVEEGRI